MKKYGTSSTGQKYDSVWEEEESLNFVLVSAGEVYSQILLENIHLGHHADQDFFESFYFFISKLIVAVVRDRLGHMLQEEAYEDIGLEITRIFRGVYNRRPPPLRGRAASKKVRSVAMSSVLPTAEEACARLERKRKEREKLPELQSTHGTSAFLNESTMTGFSAESADFSLN